MLRYDLRKVTWPRRKEYFKFHRRSLIISPTWVIQIPIDFYFTLNFISLVRFFVFDKIQFEMVNKVSRFAASFEPIFGSKKRRFFLLYWIISTWRKKRYFHGPLSIFSLAKKFFLHDSHEENTKSYHFTLISTLFIYLLLLDICQHDSFCFKLT